MRTKQLKQDTNGEYFENGFSLSYCTWYQRPFFTSLELKWEKKPFLRINFYCCLLRQTIKLLWSANKLAELENGSLEVPPETSGAHPDRAIKWYQRTPAGWFYCWNVVFALHRKKSLFSCSYFWSSSQNIPFQATNWLNTPANQLKSRVVVCRRSHLFQTDTVYCRWRAHGLDDQYCCKRRVSRKLNLQLRECLAAVRELV